MVRVFALLVSVTLMGCSGIPYERTTHVKYNENGVLETFETTIVTGDPNAPGWPYPTGSQTYRRPQTYPTGGYRVFHRPNGAGYVTTSSSCVHPSRKWAGTPWACMPNVDNIPRYR